MPETKEMQQVFSSIAPRYDFLNHFLSLNIDKAWRRKLVKQIDLKPGFHVLDLCTGTGDIAIEMTKQCRECRVVGFDLCQEMLDVGEEKVMKLGLHEQIEFMQGNALELPFEDATFDVITIGFGLRNLPDPQKGIQEMGRVLKKGGRLFILEFSPEQQGFFGRLYQFQLKHLVPFFGGIISGSRGAYEYLATSIPDFLTPKRVLQTLADAAFESSKAEPLTGQIAYIYEARK